MPGLAGFVCHRDPPQCAGALDRMVASISHGPFARTIHRVTADGLAAAQVHTGVPSYPDPVAPRPAGSSDINVWLDGTLHALETPSGRRPVSAGDDPALTLAGLYEADPDFGFLPGLDGIFAAVVHDAERRLLHLITDRYGLRQLYWSRTPGGTAWSSELKAFTHLPGFSPVISRLAVRQFFEAGYLLEDTSWFEGVELVPSGSVLTCHLDGGSVSVRRYWWWSDIAPQSVPDTDDVTDELGGLFRQAVALRADGLDSLAVMLSGGLDSRAVLAALPAGTPNVETFTFGQAGCLDEIIARRVSAVAGVPHHFLEIDARNWLDGRLNAVWRTDGNLDLMHMHGVRADAFISERARVNMSGFAGDLILGGSYLPDPREADGAGVQFAANVMGCDPGLLDYRPYEALSSPDFYFLQNRVRRFTASGTLVGRPFLEYYKPFHDYALIDFVYALPDALRVDSRLYNRMLLRFFPDYYRTIPWQRTGAPISASRTSLRAALMRRRVSASIDTALAALGLRTRQADDMVNYGDLLRQPDAVRMFEDLVLSGSALSSAYRDPGPLRAAWTEHLAGRPRESELFRALTFEVWLRQVFDGTHRGALD